MAPVDTITVVLADDDENIRVALRDLFGTAQGIDVVAEAQSAEEAVAACRAHSPRVALLDIRMPGDGLRAAREITTDGLPTRVVMLTGDDTPEARVAAADSGATRFVAKSGGENLVSVVLEVAGGS